MGLFDRVEAKLERAVNGVFARAFKAEVQPVEIASAIRRAMDDRAAVVGKGRTFVPNDFSIELSSTDFDRLAGYEQELADELVAAAQEHADSQHYQPSGDFAIHLLEDHELETGVFRVRPSTVRTPGRDHSGYAAPAPSSPGPAQPAYQPPMSSHAPAAYQEPSAYQPPAAYEPPAGPVIPAFPEPAGPPVPVGPAVPANAPRGVDSMRTGPASPEASSWRANPSDRPWLDVDGDRYPLLGALTVVGRDDSSDVILDDPGISRRHAEIRVTSDGPHWVATIRDLDSTNGTYVNGERITTAHLADHDQLTVGRTTVTFRAGR